MKIGDTIDGKYELLRLIGQGGMGAVFEARHHLIKRHYAVKVLHPQLSTNESVVQRFILEAQAAAAIGSEHIIEVTDAGQTAEGSPYLVMELLEGEDLDSLLDRERRLAPARVAALLIQAGVALSAAHRAGIVHRDLKPANLFVARRPDGGERVKVLDFGVAKFKDLSLTSTQTVLGTLYYMAPEQAEESKQVDCRADVYSMGVILYQALSGWLPYRANDFRQLLAQILVDEPRPLRSVLPDVSVELERVVQRTMAKDRAARYQTMDELVDALRPFLEAPGPTPEPLRATGAIARAQPLVSADPLGLPAPESPVEASTGADSAPASGLGRRSLLVGLFTVLGVCLVCGAVWLTRSDALGDSAAPGDPAGTEAAHASAPTDEVPHVEPTWVLIEAGDFEMGSPPDEEGRDADEVRHPVKLTRSFRLLSTEVTQRQWRELIGNNPSLYTGCGPDCPVERVNWFEAVAYVNELSSREGLERCYEVSGCGGAIGGGCSSGELFCAGDFRCSHVSFSGLDCRGYRLPTEAEWEYAARAGTTTPFSTGPVQVLGQNNAPALDPFAWYGGNSGVSYPGATGCRSFRLMPQP